MVVMVRIFLEIKTSLDQGNTIAYRQHFCIDSMVDSLDHKILYLKEILEIILSPFLISLLKIRKWRPRSREGLIPRPRKCHPNSTPQPLSLTRKRKLKAGTEGEAFWH